MKLAVVGCATDYDMLRRACDRFTGVTEIITITSDANADVVVDTTSLYIERYAEEAGAKLTVVEADWARLGQRAGSMRNREVVHAADQVVAFWDGQSPAVRSVINISIELEKPVVVIDTDEGQPSVEESTRRNANRFAYRTVNIRYTPIGNSGHMILPAKK